MPPEAENADKMYDFIVVGSGAGGGPVASALAKSGYDVLLLEAGGEEQPDNYPVPAFHAFATEDPKLSWDYFVRHYADDDRSRADPKFSEANDGVFYPRSGTLGGCTAHHAMITIPPPDSDWDRIARLTGDDTWSADNMRLYFQRLERNRYRRWSRWMFKLTGINFGQHGYHGWLPVDMASPKLLLEAPRLRKLVISAALAAEKQLSPMLRGPLERLISLAVGLRDVNGRSGNRPSPEGVRLVPISTDNGRRAGTRELIETTLAAFPDKLTVKLNSLATQVILQDDDDGVPRAVGVRGLTGRQLFDDATGEAQRSSAEPFEVRCKREVILAAGAFNTPQLLMLSGIGPKEELLRHRIQPVLDRPGVGNNLQDRYEVGVISELKKPFKLLKGATFRAPVEGARPDPLYRRWLRGKGPYTTNGSVLAVLRKSDAGRQEPDLFCFGLIGSFRGYYPGYSRDGISDRKFTWAILKAHTENRAGRVALKSADPLDPPDINFHYFDEGSGDHQSDLNAVVDGVKFVRSLIAQSDELEEEFPGNLVRSDDEIRQFVKDNAWGHHASCSCAMGRPDDKNAVVDSRFRVIGARGLRIVDASIFPRIPGFFIVAPIYMISEKAADVIISDARAAGPAAL